MSNEKFYNTNVNKDFRKALGKDVWVSVKPSSIIGLVCFVAACIFQFNSISQSIGKICLGVTVMTFTAFLYAFLPLFKDILKRDDFVEYVYFADNYLWFKTPWYIPNKGFVIPYDHIQYVELLPNIQDNYVYFYLQKEMNGSNYFHTNLVPGNFIKEWVKAKKLPLMISPNTYWEQEDMYLNVIYKNLRDKEEKISPAKWKLFAESRRDLVFVGEVKIHNYSETIPTKDFEYPFLHYKITLPENDFGYVSFHNYTIGVELPSEKYEYILDEIAEALDGEYE